MMTGGIAHRVLAPQQTSTVARQSSYNTNKGQTMPKSTNAGTKPVHKIRHGAVSASIWRKDTQKGPMFNVSFQRS
jgi:hypothetical protein